MHLITLYRARYDGGFNNNKNGAHLINIDEGKLLLGIHFLHNSDKLSIRRAHSPNK